MELQVIRCVLLTVLFAFFCNGTRAQNDQIVRAVLEHPSGGIVVLQRGKPLLDACDRAIQSGEYKTDRSAMCKLYLARAFALTAFGEDRVDDIIATAEMAVACEPTNTYAVIHEAFLKYMLRNDTKSANKVVELYPNDAFAILLSARMKVNSHPQLALKAVDRVLALPDQSRTVLTEAHYIATRAYVSQGKYEKGIDCLNVCMTNCGGQASPLGSFSLHEILTFRLDIAHRAGRFEIAEADALELIYRHPNQPAYAHALVITQIDLGRHVTAVAAAESVNQQFPAYHQRSVLLAAAYNRAGRHAQVAGILTGFDHDAASLTELALALWLNGNRQSAIEKLDAAIDKEKGFAPAFALRAALRATDPKATVEEKKLADADAEAALKFDPNGSYGYVAKMLAAAAADDFLTAATAAGTALKLNRRPPSIKDEIAKAQEAYTSKRSFVTSSELILSVPSYRLPSLSAK